MKFPFPTILIAVLMVVTAFSFFLEGAQGDEITGRTQASTGLMQSASFTTVEVFDIDDDGQDEMVLGGAGRNNPKTQGIHAYTYHTGNSTWTKFGSGLPGTSSGEYYGGLGLGDLNKDGFMDIAAPIPSRWYSTSTQEVQIYTSNSGNAFTKSHTISIGQSSNEAEIVDLDGDGNQDIVVSYYQGVKTYFGSGTASTWDDSSPTANSYEMDGVGVGDLNGDGLMDLVATPYFNTKKIYMYIQGASRSWSEVTFKDSGSEAFGVKIADINGDGYNDVIYGDRSHGMKLWCGNGGGSTGGTSFTWTDNSTGLPTGSGSWQQVELGDVDNDGDLDVTASSNGQSRVRIFINNLPNSWTEMFSSNPEHMDIGGSAYGANFGDWNGDGKLDIAGCSWGGGVDAWIINRGTTPPPPENKLPVPDAGEDQEIVLGASVQLNGRGSLDPEDAPSGDISGNILDYDWNVTSYPAGSLIRDGSLSPSDSDSAPTFTPDAVGTYVITLSVMDTDDEWSNESDEDEIVVTVLKPNDPPVADAGSDRSGLLGEEISLDGSESYDPDGAIEYFEWECTTHSVSISGQGTQTAVFTPSVAEMYSFRLRVRDDNDTWSGYDHVNVTIVNPGQNVPPIADAGPNQEVMLGDTVTLDGSGSFDNDGSIVTWDWDCTSHTVTFQDLNSSSPSFTPTESGTFMISLRVMDDNNSWSGFDTVEIFVEQPYFNNRPVADAGEDIEAYVGDLVRLDGRDSFDLNGVISEYNWTCTSHDVTLSDSLSARPSFVPDLAQTYIFTLAVSDDEGAWSGEDEVNVIISEVPEDPVFSVTLGPFLYEDNNPISGAQVILSVDGTEFTEETDAQGEASFEDVPEGEHSARVRMDGNVVIASFSVSVDSNGAVTYPDSYGKAQVIGDPDDDDDDIVAPPDDDDGSDKGGSSAVVAVVIIIFVTLLIVGGAVLFFLMQKKRGEEGEGDEDHEEDQCPHCGGEVDEDSDFNRKKCKNCGRYS